MRVGHLESDRAIILKNNCLLSETLQTFKVFYKQNESNKQINQLTLAVRELENENSKLLSKNQVLEKEISGHFSIEIENLKSDLAEFEKENSRIYSMLMEKEMQKNMFFKENHDEEYKAKIDGLEQVIKILVSEKESALRDLKMFMWSS